MTVKLGESSREGTVVVGAICEIEAVGSSECNQTLDAVGVEAAGREERIQSLVVEGFNVFAERLSFVRLPLADVDGQRFIFVGPAVADDGQAARTPFHADRAAGCPGGDRRNQMSAASFGKAAEDAANELHQG